MVNYGAFPENEELEGLKFQSTTQVDVPKRTASKVGILIGICVLALYGFAYSSENRQTVQMVTDTLQIKIYNDYTKQSGAAVEYPWISDYLALVEPFKLTTFSVENANEECTYSWTINSESFLGSELDATVRAGGVLPLSVKEFCSGVVTREYSDKIISKYVRREIRTLSTFDREAFFSALEIVYSTDLETGQELYGSKFFDASYYVRVHNDNAADRICDHFHGGMGFSTQHAGYTLMFEQTLQSINPSLTVPYWDYTIEAYYVDVQGTPESWRSTEYWLDDWFGDAEPDSYVVSEGRFAYLPITTDAVGFAVETNAYGYLRAPWNVNPIPFVTRYNGVYGVTLTDFPDCEAHFDEMNDYDDLFNFVVKLQFLPHGTIHTAIGGVWGADYATKLQDAGYTYTNSRVISTEAFGWQKNLWRAEIMECAATCTSDAAPDECKCLCPLMEQYINDGTCEDILSEIFPAYMITEGLLENSDGEDKSQLMLQLLCNDFDDITPIIGDSLESASPADPTFWAIHPTVERLLVWKRINGFVDETWVNDQASSVGGTSVGYCLGHNDDDLTFFRNLFDNDDRYYTNMEILAAGDPYDVMYPYVYDNFQWPHCEELGFPADMIDVTRK